MCLENLEVVHKSFGAGVVSGRNGKYFTVKFASGEKTFVYPDIFEKFLTLADGSVSDEIKSDLLGAKNQKQRILDKKNEENLRAMTHGIVIPGKEKVDGDGDEEDGHNKNSTESESF